MKVVWMFFGLLTLFSPFSQSEPFKETIVAYGVIKPGAITTLVAVNNGIVTARPKLVGDRVLPGTPVIEVMERESQRQYRSSLTGQVAKWHVTVGATVTPGMPLVTLLDPSKKEVEISLSASEAKRVSMGAAVETVEGGKSFGVIQSISPLVDPDTGAVTTYVHPNKLVENLIGDVVPLRIIVAVRGDCESVKLSELGSISRNKIVESVSGEYACIRAPAEVQTKPKDD